ncbi:MAG: hypothetical protein ABIO02_00630 [Patescibacteria group bacterium]
MSSEPEQSAIELNLLEFEKKDYEVSRDEPEITLERLRDLQTLELEITGNLSETLTKLNETLNTSMVARPDGFHLTIISPPESGTLSQLTSEQIKRLQQINQDILQGKGVELTGIGFIDGSNADNMRAADKAKKTSFLTFSIPALQELRNEIGLSEKDFHVTLGFEGGDIHMQEQVNAETGKKVVSAIRKLLNPTFSALVPDTVNFGGITGQERIKK